LQINRSTGAQEVDMTLTQQNILSIIACEDPHIKASIAETPTEYFLLIDAESFQPFSSQIIPETIYVWDDLVFYPQKTVEDGVNSWTVKKINGRQTWVIPGELEYYGDED
jgi:hypothetical protein